MSYVIAVAVALFFAVALTLASPDKFSERLKKHRVLVAVMCIDVVFIVMNLILAELLVFQLIPAVKCIVAMVLTVVTVLAALAGSTDRISVYAIVCVLALFFLTVGVVCLPKHNVREFDGEEYVGVVVADSYDFGSMGRPDEDGEYILYYRKVSPFVILTYYDYVELYDGTINKVSE